MRVSLIVAMSENRVIGHHGRLPWHLSQDLRRFKRLTMGHHIIMGRKTLESIGRLLPGRETVIITRNPCFVFPGAQVAHSFEEALEMANGDEEAFIVGGAQIYRVALPRADRIYLTLIHADFPGDATFPKLRQDDWELREDERHRGDERMPHDYSFRVFDRRSAPEI